MASLDHVGQAYFGYRLMRRRLFALDPELAHNKVLAWLKLLQVLHLAWLPALHLARFRRGLGQDLLGCHFPTPIGLAAGFDKNAELLKSLHYLGFGFAEVGTVTLHAQEGNPTPRVWRHTEQGALVNRLGFNNRGALEFCRRLKNCRRHPIPIGVNLGRGANTSNETAVHDYRTLMKWVYPHADYLTINVSSPNTEGLRELGQPQALEPLLADLAEHSKRLAILHGINKRAILVKLKPELQEPILKEIAGIIERCGIDGVIACNTLKVENGGMSGLPLFDKSIAMVKSLRRLLAPDKVIVGVGGVFAPEQALDMLHAGANLVQIYTGLVFRGPQLITHIHKHLAAQFRRSHMPTVKDYIAAAHTCIRSDS
jgi:dihydroorotate dehydrogenase